MENRANRGKKGQAVTEFLITYGWAVLIIVVMVAALASLAQTGVIKSDYILTERCILSAGIACVDFAVREESASVYLMNSMGREIEILNISIGENCTGEFNHLLDYGSARVFDISGCSNGLKKARFDSQIIVHYRESRLTGSKTAKGRITAKIQP